MSDPSNHQLNAADVLEVGLKVAGIAGVVGFVKDLPKLAGRVISATDLGPKSGFQDLIVHPQYEIRTVAIDALALVLSILVIVFARSLARKLGGENRNVTSLADGLRIAASILGVLIVVAAIPLLLSAILDYTGFGVNYSLKNDGTLEGTLRAFLAPKVTPIIYAALKLCTGLYFATGAKWLVDHACGIRSVAPASQDE